MKKVFLVLFPILLAVVVFFSLQFFFDRDGGKGALQVTAEPEANVFLNGDFIGKTPLCKCDQSDMLPVGNYSLRISPKEEGLPPYEEKIVIVKSVLTVVDRSFGKGSLSHGSVITLEKLNNKNDVEILVISFPNATDVYLDGSKKGQTPLLLKDITQSDHEIKLIKNGYREKSVRIKTNSGYKLIATVALATNLSPTPTLSEDLKGNVATTSAASAKVRVKILDTPTGFLRVRKEGSSVSEEIGRVLPGESYEVIDEKSGWFKIRIKNGSEGWVSAQYAKKE